MKEVKIITLLTTLVLSLVLLFSGCKTVKENLVSENNDSSVADFSSAPDVPKTEASTEASNKESKLSDISSTETSSTSQTESKTEEVSQSTVHTTESQITSSITSSAASQPASSAPQSSEPVSTPASSVPQSSVPASSVSTVVSETVSSQPTVSVPAQKPQSTPAPYTVTDPENTRGLDNTRKGCYYGVAKDDKPHQLSIDNQLSFDRLQNIKALALDTVSNDNGMYLTFDCGYEYNNITALILDTLKAKNVKAAFFCTLSYLENNPQLVRRMIDEGHIVGNHSATHPDFTTLTRTQMANELYLFDKYLTEKFGYTSEYFRFPGGYHSENTLELVTSLGYKSVFWSVAHKDWETANQPEPNTAFETVTSRYHSGAVILLHAVSKTNSDILARLIDNAHQRGYKFKTLDEYFE